MNIWDIVIKNAKMVDPERRATTYGSIGLSDGKISIITDKEIKGREEIDAKKHIVSPGFIDIHAHVDGNIGCAELSLVQGVTTTVGGNCGGGPVDLKLFLIDKINLDFLLIKHSL